MVSIQHPGELYVCLLGKIKMLFDKIIRIGYIIQTVKDIPPNSNHGSNVIVSQCNMHPLHNSGNDVFVGSDLPKKFLLRVRTYCLMSTVLPC